ncbi:MAG: amino acid decarboxylase [Gracilibacteraceae bacterium]|nr:amino acid decarboxylase [Gracilibacteraceae bacterium]
MALRENLAAYALRGLTSFHTPGHKGRPDMQPGVEFPAHDLTELPELDMLHAPAGVILAAERRAAAVFGAERTYFLVNGATCGNQAMLLALAAGGRGGPVLTDRRAHRSAAAGFVLSGLKPLYIPAVVHPDFGLPLGLAWPEKPDLRGLAAIHLTSPSYYGTVTDIAAPADTRAETAPDTLLFVDAAHGAHFFGPLFPPSPLAQGADAVLHSAHKTLGALTQGAMLHARGRGLRLPLAPALEMLQTSSPSYLLLASLEAAAEQAEREGLRPELREEAERLRAALGGDLRILNRADAGAWGVSDVDWSKILVNLRPLRAGAEAAVEWLRTEGGVEPELWDGENILFLLGVGSTAADVRRLRRALENLVLQVKHGNLPRGDEGDRSFPAGAPPLPPLRLTPREAWFAPKRSVPLAAAAGLIAGETVSVYPPGIPLVMAGEEITPEILTLWRAMSGARWQGWSGRAESTALIIDIL